MLLLATGCAATKQYVPFPNQMVRIEHPDKARIYVLRPYISGMAVSYEVKDGVIIVGKMGPRGYLCWEREPGETVITSKLWTEYSLPLSVVKGMVYYIEQGRKLIFLDEAKWRKTIVKCKPPLLVR